MKAIQKFLVFFVSAAAFAAHAEVIQQYTFKPNPGSDPAAIYAQVAEAGGLWKKHGAKVSYWTVVAGEQGVQTFSVSYENMEAYGKSLTALSADPAFSAFSAKLAKSGFSTWVRSNLMQSIPLP